MLKKEKLLKDLETLYITFWKDTRPDANDFNKLLDLIRELIKKC